MTQHDQKLYDELYLTAKTLLIHGTKTESIEKHLLQKTEDLVLIAVVIKEAKKDYYSSLQQEGIKLIGIGACCIALGFLITFLNFNSNRSFIFAMYGFTSLGVILVFWGLYKLIG